MISSFLFCTNNKKEVKGQYVTYTEKYTKPNEDSPAANWDTFPTDLGHGLFRYEGDFNPRDITYLEQKLKKTMKNIYEIRFTFHNKKDQSRFFTFKYKLKEPLSVRGDDTRLSFEMRWDSNTNKVTAIIGLDEIGPDSYVTNAIDYAEIVDIPANLDKDESDKKLLTTIEVFVDFAE